MTTQSCSKEDVVVGGAGGGAGTGVGLGVRLGLIEYTLTTRRVSQPYKQNRTKQNKTNQNKRPTNRRAAV